MIANAQKIKNERRANLPDAMIKLNAGTDLRQNQLFGKRTGRMQQLRI
jgi:hypothetical protein